MAKPIGARVITLHPFFVSIGGSLLITAFFTDFMYSTSSLMQWANFSAWLITGGLVLALISAIVLVIELVMGRVGLIDRINFGLLGVAAILSIFNVFVHTRDAWTSVVPAGITLSAIVTILLIVAGLRRWSAALPRRDVRGDVA